MDVGTNKMTHAGHPSPMERQAKIVFPRPYPSLWNIAGANSGKPKPASERRKETAARAGKGKFRTNEYIVDRENINAPEAE